AVGNAVEVEEAIATLRGGGPADLVEVTLALAAEMLRLVGIAADPAAALSDGRALASYRRMIIGQGGDPDAPLPAATQAEIVTPPASGWLCTLDARAGRPRKDAPVRGGPVVFCLARRGEQVELGQPVLELRSDERPGFARAREALSGAIEIGPEPPEVSPPVLERIGL